MRATKNDGTTTTYYLYDGGQLLLEETYNGTTTSIPIAYAWGADGLRARYEASGPSYYAYFYDPQGSYVERQIQNSQTSGALDTASYDGWGRLIGDESVAGSGAYARSDTAGFGGLYGYYTDKGAAATGFVLLGHRYYDPGTGRFVNRDPIGYNGGQDLYVHVVDTIPIVICRHL